MSKLDDDIAFLNAEEAWDYLAGGEERRCLSATRSTRYRVRKGRLEWSDGFGWFTHAYRGEGMPPRLAPYAIAPDEPAARAAATEAALADLPPNPQRDSWVRGEMAIGLDTQEAEARDRIREAGEAFERRVEAHGMGKLQALGALADALPVDVEAERAISKLAAAKRADREVRPIERSCCREARERVAELEGRLARYQTEQMDRLRDLDAERSGIAQERDAALVKVADLEAKLAEAEAGNVEDYAGACEERDAAIAERDKLADEYSAIREHAGLSDSHETVNGYISKLRAEVERLTKDNEHLKFVIESTDDTPAMFIALPTDTTTPLDPAQRAVALMGERLVALDGRTIRQNGDWYDILLEHGWVALDEEDTILRDLIDPTVTVTLAPEPAPERRKLTFGEAVEYIPTSGGAEFTAKVDGLQLRLKGDVFGRAVVVSVTGRAIGITPAMLAAEWEAAQ